MLVELMELGVGAAELITSDLIVRELGKGVFNIEILGTKSLI